ncbi:MAG TPA: bilirubin oxidase [Prolixibacteraceae bacterium]|jgi:FtsP/CotA-like multicopper oxidase with cupredoxin domain|nr:bilirubin oxidase [Prolixibacteraceae bacterium]
MKILLHFFSVALIMITLGISNSSGQYPGSGQISLDPSVIPQFVDPLPHFAGLRVNAKEGGNLIVRAVETQQVAVSTGTVLDNGIVGTTPGAGLGNYFVYSISKDAGETWTLPLWPAFTIEAQKGSPLNVEVRNELNGLTYKDVNITADQTIMMNGVPLTGDPLTDPYTGPIPIAMHLHGGEVQSTSDGGPDAWFTPGYALKGKGWDEGVGPILHYPNQQEATTIWFHEHSQLGLTRINVYAGMAGFYFIRGLDEELHRLPGWSKDDLVQEVTPDGKVADALHPGPYLPEIEIAIQDRLFDTNGQLYYPIDEPTNPDIHPFWSPEFFGDIITVNGKTWPYLSVAPRKYRFHFLDGSNARFYNLWLQNLATGEMGPAIYQIGTDGGMLDRPVVLDPQSGQKLLLGCGERADVIIDFSKVAPGTVFILMNDANAPFPNGDPVELGTTDRIMQFIVNGKLTDGTDANKKGTDRSFIPPHLRISPLVKLTDFEGHVNINPDVTRQLTLNEILGDGGPEMVLLNNSRYEDMPEMGMFGKVTEKPTEGNTEKWQLINTTMDAHPMHMHLVQFQLVSRQDFDAMKYMEDYMGSFTGVNGGTPGMLNMFMGAEGPPFLYDVKNADGAVGGNLPIINTIPANKYNLGAPIPAQPNERGWKDVILAYPNQVTTYIVRFAPTELPLWTPKAMLRYSFDPSYGPGYMWHCHIVEHEDNDMMRPLQVQPNPSRNIFKSAEIASVNPTSVVEGFELGQNFPNPFNSETVIQFRLPEDSRVQLKLYNYLGEEVKTLLDAHAKAGNQTIRLSTENLANGIYFYQLNAGTYSSTKKLEVSR